MCNHVTCIDEKVHRERTKTNKNLSETIALTESLLSTQNPTITTKWKIPIQIDQYGASATLMADPKTRTSLNLNDLVLQRDRKKVKLVENLSKCRQFEMQPTAGEYIYFEMEFKNPFSEMKKFWIEIQHQIDDECSSGDLKIVTNTEESHFQRQRCLFHQTIQSHMCKVLSAHEIIIDANKSVYIPFKFQSWTTKVSSLEATTQQFINVEIFAMNGYEKNITSVKESQMLFITNFKLRIHNIKTVIDRCFDIHNCENTKICCTIPLPDIHSKFAATIEEHSITVKCSDDTIVAYDLIDNAGIPSICIQCDSPKLSQQTQFYVFVYNDKYCSDLNETWQINILPYRSTHVNCILGGTHHKSMHLENYIKQNNHICHCDNIEMIRLNDTIDDNGNVTMQIHPTSKGKYYSRVHVVDQQRQELGTRLVDKMLLVTVVDMPQVRSTFFVNIGSNINEQNENILFRSFPYTNKYNSAKQYQLSSNFPHVVQVTTPVVNAPSQANIKFGLQIFASNIAGHREEIFLFVTHKGILEDCFRLELRKSEITKL